MVWQQRLAFVMAVASCSPDTPQAPPAPARLPPARSGQEQQQQIVFSSPENCREADIAITTPEANLDRPHQVDEYVHLFPSVDVTTMNAAIGKHILLIDHIAPPVRILQRLPITAELRAIALR